MGLLSVYDDIDSSRSKLIASFSVTSLGHRSVRGDE